MRGLDLDGCHSPSNVVSSLQLVRSWIHIHLWTWSTEAGSFSVQGDSVGRNTVHLWQPVVAAEESQESSNTSMRLVIADAACQRFLWDDRVEHGTVIYDTILYRLHCIYVHICSGTSSAVVSELEWIHLGVGDIRQMSNDCQSLQHLHHHWRQSHGAVVVQRF